MIAFTSSTMKAVQERMQFLGWQVLNFSMFYDLSLWCFHQQGVAMTFWRLMKSNGNSLQYLGSMEPHLPKAPKEVTHSQAFYLIGILTLLESNSIQTTFIYVYMYDYISHKCMYVWINIFVSFYSNRFPCNIFPKIFIVSYPSLYGKNSSSFLNTAVIPDKSIIQSEVV